MDILMTGLYIIMFCAIVFVLALFIWMLYTCVPMLIKCTLHIFRGDYSILAKLSLVWLWLIITGVVLLIICTISLVIQSAI